MTHQTVRHLWRSRTEGTMKRLCFVLVLVLAGAASGAIEKRMTGSKDCGTDRQYHVKIESVQGRKSCGGSLINTRWVLTASHCAEQIVNVKLGEHNDVSIFSKAWSFMKGSSKKNEQEIKLNSQFTYKDEEGNTHDIMLIKLNEDVSAKLPVIKLPPPGCSKPEEHHEVQVGGWGPKTNTDKNPSSKLRCATTSIVQCEPDDKPEDKYHSDDDTTMCAFKPGVEACFGDGGTAVEYSGKLHGIIVNKPIDTCANRIVILNICHYREWIDKTMKEH